MNALAVPIGGVALFVLAAAFVDPAIAAALLAGLTFTRLPSVYLHSESVAPAVLAVIFGVAAAAMWRREGGRRDRRALVFGLAGLSYLALLATSYLWAADTAATTDAVRQLALVLVLCVGFIATLHDTRALRWVAGTIMAGGALLALLSLHQVLTSGYHRTYGGFAVSQVENIVGSTNAYRIGGPFGDPNYFGQLMLLPVAFGLQRLHAARSFGGRFVALAVVGLCSATILLTYSRGALIALIAIFVIWLWATPAPRTRALLLAGAIGALLVTSLLLPNAYRDRISQVKDVIPGIENAQKTTSDSALRGRQSALIVGWRMFADHPVVGVGAGNFQGRYLEYAESVGLFRSGEQLAPHSLLVQVASETGIVGILVFGSLIVGAFAALRRSRRALLDIEQREDAGLVAAIRNALIGYLIAGLFLHAAYPQTLWLLLALAWATPQCLPPAPRRSTEVAQALPKRLSSV